MVANIDKLAWEPWGWEPVQTADGSYSLQLQDGQNQELMHHRQGALTETRYIYGRLIDKVFKFQLPSSSFVSVGLGLGYNELLVAERSQGQAFYLASYEKDHNLVSFFLQALGLLPKNEDFQRIEPLYQHLFSHFDAAATEYLVKAYHQGQWVIEGALQAGQNYPQHPIHGYLWDAFSRKTSPDLWEESFLTHWIGGSADPKVTGLTTYACNGPLKRALKTLGFEIQELPGFQGKRLSTMAWRLGPADV